MTECFSLISIFFFAYFALSLLVFYIVPPKWQWHSILLFSAFFFLFTSVIHTIFYLVLAAIITYFSSNRIYKNKNNVYLSRWYLILGILGNLFSLVLLKYISFFLANINSIARVTKGIPELIHIPSWAAPIGISFYTLSAIGYITDCYWGVCEPTGNFFKDLLFICYWPILTSGPILKHGDIAEQLYSEHTFDIDQICFGIQRMLWGIIKKIVISTRLGVIVDTIYGDTATYDGLYIWVAAVFWVFQLYTDFSGCMDIVLGASECYGIVLPENFRTPFFAKSIQEFWQRWHITLGGWYKEYILYPLLNTKWLSGIEKKYKKKYSKKIGRLISSCIGMLFVWLLFGLWHGGKWKYVAMGLFFYTLIVFENVTGDWFDKLWKNLGVPTKSGGWKVLQCFKVFILVTIGYMFFRVQNVKITLATWRLGLKWNPWIFFDDSLYNLGLSRKSFNLMLVSLLILLVVSLFQRKGSVRKMIAAQPLVIRWAVYLALLFAPVILGIYGPEYDAKAFIYGGF